MKLFKNPEIIRFIWELFNNAYKSSFQHQQRQGYFNPSTISFIFLLDIIS